MCFYLPFLSLMLLCFLFLTIDILSYLRFFLLLPLSSGDYGNLGGHVLIVFFPV